MTLPKSFDVEVNKSLLNQAVRVYEDRTHFGFAKVKTRSEVDMTKKKVYKQKGTGGARHGAKSAHIFIGGGVVHGPTGEKRDLKMSTKMKQKALAYSLSFVAKNKKLVAIDGLTEVKKTAEAVKLINNAKNENQVKGSVVAVLPNEKAESLKFFRNISNLNTVLFKDLNALFVLKSSLVILDSGIFEAKKETKAVKDSSPTKTRKVTS